MSSQQIPNWQRLREQPELWEQFLVREQVNRGIRQFFFNQGFNEVETPLLVEHPGTEPYLEVFETTLISDQGKRPAFLLTSPEYAMKKLIVAGLHNVFQICKSFRNGEGLSRRHNPEFTILEWYRSPGSYLDIMDDCEQLLQFLAGYIQDWRHGSGAKIGVGKGALTYNGQTYDISSPWERISVAEAFQKYVGITAETLLDEAQLKQVAAQHGYHVDAETTWEQAYNQLLLNHIEPHLGVTKPTILYDYPASQAALSAPKKSDPRFAERFEFFLAGLELGNAFSELTNPAEQERRFRQELAERAALGKTPYELDHDYIEALKTGLPPTGGIAVGVDRLVMLLADATDIRQVTYFPVDDTFTQD